MEKISRPFKRKNSKDDEYDDIEDNNIEIDDDSELPVHEKFVKEKKYKRI